MKLAGLWRMLAIGVALMAWLDPPVGVRTVPSVTVDVFVAEGRELAARTLIAEAASERPAHIQFDPVHAIAADRPAPCAPTRTCVVLGRAPDVVRLPADALARVALVTLPSASTPEARVTQVVAPGAHARAAAQAVVSVDSRGLAGERGRVVLAIADQPVGSAELTFGTDGRTEVVVPWVPPATSPVVLKASVEVSRPASPDAANAATSGGGDAASGAADRPGAGADTVRVIVPVRTAPWPVMVYDARPSWTTTFVRRAIEDDPRFSVAASAGLAPGVTVGRGVATRASMTESALDDTHVVVVGAAEQLSATDVGRLERFVRERGGALVLLPDREWSGPVTRLLPGRWGLATSVEPRRVGPLTGHEWLLADQLGPADARVLSDGNTVGATVTPLGHGLLLVSGAIDAWRFRGDGTEWNRYWVRLLADLASRTPGRLDVTTRAGSRAGQFVLDVRRRSLTAPPTLQVSARQHCGDDIIGPLRVWPGLHLDQFVAEVSTAQTSCVARVTAGGDEATVMLPAASEASALGARALDEWAPDVIRAGGHTVTTGAAGLGELLGRLPVPDAVDDVRYPMRSPLWMIAFLGALGLEWWLRRRAGGR